VVDPLYLSLWFPSFDVEDILPHTLAALQAFPFSSQRPGVVALSLHPISWDEPTILERRFRPGIAPEAAVEIAADLLHADYAYVFEAYWDLWTLPTNGDWTPQPCPVKFIARGLEFDEEASEQEGHIQIDFGLDSPFLQENVQLTTAAEAKVRSNVQKLVDFTAKAEKNSGASARLLWSESDENLAQKLIARLQKVQ
jgi:hypothetical protein